MARSSGNWTGLNVEEVRRLAERFDDKAEELEEIINDIDSQWADTTWQGKDAESFEETWDDHKKVLKQIIGNFEKAAEKARADAKAQEDASSS